MIIPIHQTARRHFLEDNDINIHCTANIKSCMIPFNLEVPREEGGKPSMCMISNLKVVL